MGKMKFGKTKIPGVFIIEIDTFSDERGSFIKIFHEKTFKEFKLDCEFREVFYSISNKNVIRGMHFQNPPYDHSKLIHVPFGSILDVVLDIRKGSPTFGDFIDIELSNNKSIYIPKGCAHGFLSLENNTNTTYLQTTIHKPDFDCGIKWNSFEMNWPIKNPMISERDHRFVAFNDFKSPFIFLGNL